jgi:RNA 2',3'-cyclic 3'-phosphodiesterase
MTAIRSFLAIELSEPVQTRLGEIILQLKNNCPPCVRWVQPRNIHLTLKFLGDVSPSNIDILTRMIESEVNNYSLFEISIGGLGAFPNLKRPRIIWIDIQAPPTLFGLQKAIETGTKRLGYAAEDRPFSPHLTLGRINHNATFDEISQIASLITKSKVEPFERLPVTTVTLFRSDLHPGGSLYTPIMVSRLGPALKK